MGHRIELAVGLLDQAGGQLPQQGQALGSRQHVEWMLGDRQVGRPLPAPCGDQQAHTAELREPGAGQVEVFEVVERHQPQVTRLPGAQHRRDLFGAFVGPRLQAHAQPALGQVRSQGLGRCGVEPEHPGVEKAAISMAELDRQLGLADTPPPGDRGTAGAVEQESGEGPQITLAAGEQRVAAKRHLRSGRERAGQRRRVVRAGQLLDRFRSRRRRPRPRAGATMRSSCAESRAVAAILAAGDGDDGGQLAVLLRRFQNALPGHNARARKVNLLHAQPSLGRHTPAIAVVVVQVRQNISQLGEGGGPGHRV